MRYRQGLSQEDPLSPLLFILLRMWLGLCVRTHWILGFWLGSFWVTRNGCVTCTMTMICWFWPRGVYRTSESSNCCYIFLKVCPDWKLIFVRIVSSPGEQTNSRIPLLHWPSVVRWVCFRSLIWEFQFQEEGRGSKIWKPSLQKLLEPKLLESSPDFDGW